MYRQHVRNRVVGDSVIAFLLKDQSFPRSVAHIIAEAEGGLAHLPRNDGPLRSSARLQRRINEFDPPRLSLEELHAFIDELQSLLSEVHEQVWSTWFQLDQPAAQQQSQSA